jgi:hypothetical protein
MTRAPLLHAMFHRQVWGDESLLRLAQERFHAADLGPEFYPENPAALVHYMSFHPGQSSGTSTVHLPRHLDLFNPRSLDEIVAFARCCGPGVRGMIVHDQPDVAGRFEEYVRQVRVLNERLEEAGPGPMLFIEYAVGLEVPRFVELFEAVRDCQRISACIDISHIAIRQCQRAFSQSHPGIDPCGMKPGSPELPVHVEEIQEVCRMAVPVVLDVIEGIGAIGKPLHFHLHDGHPSSTFSEFGVSDHLSFFQEIPIPFSHRGAHALPTIFGPLGLLRVVSAAQRTPAADLLSFTLEIHPPAGHRELGEYGHLFRHWRDLRNGERMNNWIDVLLQNHRLLRDAWGVSDPHCLPSLESSG